ncbi:hypothetical protein [Lachnoclostridium phytofermentans]|uniref:DUF4352 domain-containing protein n=1 Tax=Lachnoclostridium phytofermentans (strain ATCC 700394 / DSM 18823 / ISDg) TaxID=357809 RepID=A9KP43_LACP7|nr:hypothetical protein [Lachnoclostridium phytofermentans]ABX43213.1 hypothetical protein Cphy_2853 [Lachnoclostridium phytofermentans ISDg]
MLKKRLLLSLAVVSMFGLTGCASSIRLTENENNIIAEYLSGVLLSQQRSYDQALIEPSPTPIPVATVTPTPSAEKPSTVSNKGNTNGHQTGANIQANSDFTEVIGIKNLTIEYTGYDIVNSFSDEYFSLDASKGKQLMVIKFNVKNTSKNATKLQLTDAGIQYQLDIDMGTILKPQLTFILNDLRYIDLEIGGKETKEAIVIFEVPKKQEMKAANLIISKDEKTAIIKLK